MSNVLQVLNDTDLQCKVLTTNTQKLGEAKLVEFVGVHLNVPFLSQQVRC